MREDRVGTRVIGMTGLLQQYMLGDVCRDVCPPGDDLLLKFVVVVVTITLAFTNMMPRACIHKTA